MAGIALFVAAATGFVTRSWLAGLLLGTLASQLFFYVEFGRPSEAVEMLFPLAYSAVPALLGAILGALISKKRGVS
jgi:hypothetical protein